MNAAKVRGWLSGAEAEYAAARLALNKARKDDEELAAVINVAYWKGVVATLTEVLRDE